MAHPARRRRLAPALLCAGLPLLAAPAAQAIALGEPEVRSALGEPLDLRIPVTLAAGESMEPSCFSLARDGGTGVPQFTAATLSLERSLKGAWLRIRSNAPPEGAALALSVRAACAGMAGDYRRDYSLALDRKPAAAARTPLTPMAIAATLIARIGDTLESIARAIFPDSRRTRDGYIAALREANPPLAALGAREPIPVDSPIALPDLREFAQRHRAERAAATASQAPTPQAARSTPRSEPRVARADKPRREAPSAPQPPSAAKSAAAPPPPAPAAPAQKPARARPTATYQLKLSAPQVDLSRTRGIDARTRAELRDRQMVLDVDDQVAAVLELRHSVRQLESKVAELQLKLAGMPSSFPPPRAEPPKAQLAKPEAAPIEPRVEAPKTQPPKAEPPKAEPARIEAPKVEAKAEAPKVEVKAEAPKVEAVKPLPPQAETPKVEPPKAEPPKLAAPQPAVTPEAPKIAPAPKPTPVEKPKSAPAPQPASASFFADDGWVRYALWLLAAMLLALATLLGVRLAGRRRAAARLEEEDTGPGEEPIVVAEEPVRAEDAAEPPVVAEPAFPEGRSVASDAELATRLPDGDADDTRRRYIEERFPEVATGAIALDDANSVIKGARLFYEDGALARAVELLQLAIERHPEEIKTWLALFEIFRLERLGGEFAELARRFKEQHGASEYWRKVQYFGREIDPGNKLFHDERIAGLETIGPAAARRMAAEASFDPITENWLNAPMDFENEVLANELRKGLMAKAGLAEHDLTPNPMPALRNIEMFTVA